MDTVRLHLPLNDRYNKYAALNNLRKLVGPAYADALMVLTLMSDVQPQ